MKDNKKIIKYILIALAVIFVVGVIGGGLFFYLNQNNKTEESKSKVEVNIPTVVTENEVKTITPNPDGTIPPLPAPSVKR